MQSVSEPNLKTQRTAKTADRPIHAYTQEHTCKFSDKVLDDYIHIDDLEPMVIDIFEDHIDDLKREIEEKIEEQRNLNHEKLQEGLQGLMAETEKKLDQIQSVDKRLDEKLRF